MSGGGAEIEKERERERDRETERQREREKIPSRLHATSAEPNVGLKLTNCQIMT